MRKILFILLMLPLAAISQQKQDTVAAVLIIKRCNTCPMQPVDGYVILSNCKPVGYLTGRKKEFPAKFKVCNQFDFYRSDNQ